MTTAPGSRARVYPRVCGGTRLILVAHEEERGLSPRVRGNPAHVAIGIVIARSIPACAGEPPSRGSDSHRASVYPRVCGGTTYTMTGTGVANGLSPRVRGNLMQTAPECLSERSIPACAGEPTCGPGVKTAMRVYPRVCGGNL